MLIWWRVLVLLLGQRVIEGKRKEVLGSKYEEKEGVFWKNKLEKKEGVEFDCVRNEMSKAVVEEKTKKKWWIVRSVD